MRPPLATRPIRAVLRLQLYVLPPAPIFSRCFTTTSRRLTRERPTKPQASQRVKNNGGDLPAFSFEGLGIGKNMKIFLLVVFGILGTIETWFWCKAIWRWWKGSSKGGEAETAER